MEPTRSDSPLRSLSPPTDPAEMARLSSLEARPLLADEHLHDLADKPKHSIETEYNGPAYWTMMLLGAGLLLPWNVCLNSLDYLGHNYSVDLAYYITLAYVYPQLPLLLIMVKWGNRLSYSFRITAMFFLEGACMLLMAGFAPVSYYITLLLVFVIGLGTAVLQSSLFGFASQFPPIFNQSLSTGQGIAGIIASVLRIITKGSMNSQLADSSLLYFALVTVVMFACIVCYVLMLRMDYTKRVLAHAGHEDVDLVGDAVQLIKSEPGADSPYNGEAETPSSPKESRLNVNYWSLLKKTSLMSFCIMMVFTVTFAVFPGEITSINYHGTVKGMSFLGGKDWWSIILFFVFNIFDTVGRYTPGFIKIFSARWLWIPSLARCAFVPIFVGCVYWHGAFQSDIFVVVAMLIFSLSNGYIASLGMMYGPALVAPHEREVTGMILSFFLQFGIFLGSQISLGVKEIR